MEKNEIYKAIEEGIEVIQENQLLIYREAIETLQGAGFLVLEDPLAIEQLADLPTNSIQIELCLSWKALGKTRSRHKKNRTYPQIGGER